jgi:hypothetical protein
MFKEAKMHWTLIMIWVKFIMLWTFQGPKNYYYFKSHFKHKKWLFSWTIFLELLKCLRTSWVEIGNGKYVNFNSI